VQTIGHYRLNLKKTKINFISCAAHKFHGPKGIGFIYISSETPIRPLIHGGAQERNMRAGTENLYGIVGMAKALELCYTHLEEHQEYIGGLREYMKQKLIAEIPGIKFKSPDNGLYTVLNTVFPPNPKSELFLFNLDIAGVAASGGSACSSGSNVGSHVIARLNNEPDSVAVRFSFSKFNTVEEIDFVVEKLREMMMVTAS
jgi:cysteine desulfurase